jgi:hypothetical protein
MKDNYDPWYIRMRDGRVIKAKSTASVRHHAEAGRVTADCTVRRERNEEWRPIAWVSEFADLFATSDESASYIQSMREKRASKPDLPLQEDEAMTLESVGVRGLVDELFAAFDATINRKKLLFGGMVLGLVMAVHEVLQRLVGGALSNQVALGHLISAGGALLVLCYGITVLARQQREEMSRMRPIRIAEAQTGAVNSWLQTFLALCVVGGVLYAGYYMIDHLVAWLGNNQFMPLIGLIVLIVGVHLFGIIMLVPLLAPIGPVEDYSAIESIRLWVKLCREKIGRVLVFESFAGSLAFVAAAPLLIPYTLARNLLSGSSGGMSIGIPGLPAGFMKELSQLGLPAEAAPQGPTMIEWLGQVGSQMVLGFALGPVLVFLVVANVILYLNLRYEFSTKR